LFGRESGFRRGLLSLGRERWIQDSQCRSIFQHQRQQHSGNRNPHVAWVNANNDTAIFGGTAGTVTPESNVTGGGMTFGTDGYSITAGAGPKETSKELHLCNLPSVYSKGAYSRNER
jgi:hypothetical protein